MPDSGIVCLSQNADVRFDFESPFQCHKLGNALWNDNWCYQQGNLSGYPDCNVKNCCTLHLGGTANDYNPLPGVEYYITNGGQNVPTETYYICCNGGTQEIFGCLDPTAINYDFSATWDPIATGGNLYASCIYPFSEETIVIKADDGIAQYQDSFVLQVVEWRDDPVIDDPYEVSLLEDDDEDIDLFDAVINPKDIPICNNGNYYDGCLMFEICYTGRTTWHDGTDASSCVVPANGLLTYSEIVFDTPDEDASWGIYADINYEPDMHFSGEDTFDFKVTDTSVTPYTSTQATVNIIVKGVPDTFTVYESSLAQSAMYVNGYEPSAYINFEPFSGFISDADFQPNAADANNKCLPDAASVFYNGTEYFPDAESCCVTPPCEAECEEYCDYVQTYCNDFGYCNDNYTVCTDDIDCLDGICYFTLNESGLFCLGYKLEFKGEGNNILSPKESMGGVAVQMGINAYNSLDTLYKANLSDPLEFVVVGTRNNFNDCCQEYKEGIYQPSCVQGMQTRFHIDDIFRGTVNTFPIPVQMMAGGDTEQIFERKAEHTGTPGSYEYTKVIEYNPFDNNHKHALKIEWGGDCSNWDSDIECVASTTGYLDLSSTGGITTIPGDVLYVSYDYFIEEGNTQAAVIAYVDGYKEPKDDAHPNGYTETVTPLYTGGLDPYVGNYGWKRAAWKIVVQDDNDGRPYAGGDIHIRFGFKGKADTHREMSIVDTDETASNKSPYTILIDNFKLELNNELTPYIEGYQPTDIIKTHYQEYLLSVKVHNSFMGFCAGDELLKNSLNGLGGGKYDLMFVTQKGNARLPLQIARRIDNKGAGAALIPNISRTEEHQKFGYVSGLLLEAGTGIWDNYNDDTPLGDNSLTGQLLQSYFLDNNSYFNGSFSRQDRGSIFLMGCESGFTLMSPKFHASDGIDVYISGVVSDAYGRHLEENGQLYVNSYSDFNEDGSSIDYGPSAGNYIQNYAMSSGGAGHGFKVGEEIGIFIYSVVGSGLHQYSCYNCLKYILGNSNTYPGEPVDYYWYQMFKLSNSSPELFTDDIDNPLSAYIPYNFGVACPNSHWTTGNHYDTPWHGPDAPAGANSIFRIPATVKDPGFYYSALDYSFDTSNLDLDEKLKYVKINPEYNISQTALQGEFNVQLSYEDYLTLYVDDNLPTLLETSTGITLDTHPGAEYTVPDVYRDIEFSTAVIGETEWKHVTSDLYKAEDFYYRGQQPNDDKVTMGGLQFFVDNIQKSLGTYTQVNLLEPINNYLADSQFGINYNHHSTLEIISDDPAVEGYTQPIGVDGIDVVTSLSAIPLYNNTINRWYWNNTGRPTRGGWKLKVINKEIGDIEDVTKDGLGNYKLKSGTTNTGEEATYVFSTYLYIPEKVKDTHNPNISVQYRQSINNTDWDPTYTVYSSSLFNFSGYNTNCSASAAEDACLADKCTWSDSEEVCFGGWQRISGSFKVYDLGYCLDDDTAEIEEDCAGEWVPSNAEYIKLRLSTGIDDCQIRQNLLDFSEDYSVAEWTKSNALEISNVDGDNDDDKYIYSGSSSDHGERTAWQLSATADNQYIEQNIKWQTMVAAEHLSGGTITGSSEVWPDYTDNFNVSVDLRGNGTVDIGLVEDGGSNTFNSATINLDKEWTRYNTNVNWNNSNHGPKFRIGNISNNQVVFIHHPQAETGSISNSYVKDYKNISCNGVYNCSYPANANYCVPTNHTKELTDLVTFTYGAQVEYRDDDIASPYTQQSEEQENYVKLPVIVTGINPPLMHSIIYDAEAVSPQEGIQDGLLVHANGAPASTGWETTLGQNLISDAYLNWSFDYSPDQGTTIVTNYPHKDNNFGVKSISSIDFSTWVYAGEYDASIIQITRTNGEVLDISRPFVHSQDNIWDAVVTAINSGSIVENKVEYFYNATLIDNSGGNPTSNLKIVTVEATQVGSEWDGDIGWTVPGAVVGTRMEGDLSVAAQPRFNALVKGEAYPVVHLYEDFDYIDLAITGSDVDGGEVLTFAVYPSDRNIISASFVTPPRNYHFSGSGEIVEAPHPLGESIAVGGPSNNPDLIDVGEVFYCENVQYADESSCIENGYQWVSKWLGESRVVSTIRIWGQNRACDPDSFVGCNTDTGVGNYDPDNDEQIVLEPNYVGDVDLTIKILDKALVQDTVNLKLQIHPVNDPPLIDIVSDTNVFMNNPTYPNDINLELRARDIENDNPIWQEVEAIDDAYCDKIAGLVVYILAGHPSGSAAGSEIISRIECSEHGRIIGDSASYFSEYTCSMANYQSFAEDQGENISLADTQSCYDLVGGNDYVPLTASFTNTPNWMANLDQFESKIGTFKQYVHIIPNVNSIGSGSIRVSATDQGFNEDGTFTEKRTGFHQLNIAVGGVSKAGPDGDIMALEMGSLGARPDTFEYSVKGDDDREEIPTIIDKDFEFQFYRYHSLTNPNERILKECGSLPYFGDVGFLNEFGECCSSEPLEADWAGGYFNMSKEYYYKQEYEDELNLLISYFKPETENDTYCDARIEPGSVTFTYRGFYDSNNMSGYEPPNVNINQLDHVKQYIVEIIDIVPNYQSWPGEIEGDDHQFCDEYTIECLVNGDCDDDGYDSSCPDLSGSSDLAFCIHDQCIYVSPNWWEEYFDGSDCAGSECDNGDFWSPFFDSLAEEWNLEMCPDSPNNVWADGTECTAGDNPNYGKVLFRAGPFTQENANLQKIIIDGFKYKYDYPSFFNVIVHATDSYGFTNHDDNLVDGTSLVKLNQTLLERFSPWQGMNITADGEVENSIFGIEARDIDERPSLGLFYYDELNKWTDWNIKYGDSYLLMEDQQVNPGGWTTNYPGEYFDGEAINKIQYSQLFDNLLVTYTPSQTIEPTEQQVLEECVKIHGLRIWAPLGRFYGEHVCTNHFLKAGNGSLSSELREKLTTELAAQTNIRRKIFDRHSIYTTTEKIETSMSLPGLHSLWTLWFWVAPMIIESLVHTDHSFEVFGRWFYGGRGWDVGYQENQGLLYHPYLSPILGLKVISYEELAPNETYTAYTVKQLPSSDAHGTRFICDLDYSSITAPILDPGDWGNIPEYSIYDTEDGCKDDCYTRTPGACEFLGTEEVCDDWISFWAFWWLPEMDWLCSSWITLEKWNCNVMGTTPIFRTQAECNAVCYIGGPDTSADCATVSSVGFKTPGSGTARYYSYNIAQQVKITDQKDVDRIFSVFLKQGDAAKTTISIEHNGSSDEPRSMTRTITWTTLEDDIYNMEDYPFGDPTNCTEYGYTDCTGTIDDDFSNNIKVIYDEDGNGILQNAPMWSYAKLDGGWYQFIIRAEGLSTDNQFTVRIYPSGKSVNGTNSGTVSMWGAQVQEIEPYKVFMMPYQPTRKIGEVGVYDFLPDVDVRTFASTDGYKSVLYKYYDELLQPSRFNETVAPLEAQFYFYVRDPFEETLFKPKMELDFIPNTLYIGQVDWGDGSDIEYADEPFKLGSSTLLKHIYEKSGVYEVHGEMFNVAMNTDGISLGIGNFKAFVIRISVGRDSSVEDQFTTLGGSSTYIPVSQTTPVIGGISKSSAYYKTVKRYSGFVGLGDLKIDLDFLFYGDEYNTELALARSDENYVGPLVGAFTGSYASESYVGLAYKDTVELYGSEGEVTASVSHSLFTGLYGDEIVSTRGFYSCHPYPDCIRSGSGIANTYWISGSGQITGSANDLPVLINRGIGTDFGELGNYLGDTDLAQVRYFNTGSIQMWEMLGFEEPNIDDYTGEFGENLLTDSFVGGGGSTVTDVSWVGVIGDYSNMYHSTPINIEPNKTYKLNISYSMVEQDFNSVRVKMGDGISTTSTSLDAFAEEELFWQLDTYEQVFTTGATVYTDNYFMFISQQSPDVAPTLTIVSISLREVINTESIEYEFGEEASTAYQLAHPGNPESPRFWNNIIPKNTNLTARSGIDNFDQNSCSQSLCIDEDNVQTWNSGYYYPVLPKLNKIGKFDESLGLQGSGYTPFGDITNWDDDDLDATITLEIIPPEYLDATLIDLDFSKVDDNTLGDNSGNSNIGIFINDYSISYDRETLEPLGERSINIIKVSKNKNRKAF